MMKCYESWYRRLCTTAASQLERQIIQALYSHVPQDEFNQMLAQWVQSSNPALYKTVLPRRQTRGVQPTVFLSGQNSPTLMEISRRRKNENGYSSLGLIVQPLTAQYLKSSVCGSFDAIAIDNGMFTAVGRERFDWDRYEKMVKLALAQEKRELCGFNFFTVPDEPFNWPKTLEKMRQYGEGVQRLRRMGAPAAIVTQNGATPENVPFDQIDAVFIGGDDAYKTGPESQAITAKAKSLGMRAGK